MNQPKIIWIIGQSAVGKESFINHLLSLPDDHQLLANLNIAPPLAVSLASLKYLCSPNQAGIRERRHDKLPQEVASLGANNRTILVKYQFVDTLDSTIEKVMDLTSHTHQHSVIYLSIDRMNGYQRLRQKDWWNEDWDIESFYNEEEKLISDTLTRLSMPITEIDSRDNFKYVVR